MKTHVESGETDYYLDNSSDVCRNIKTIYCDDNHLIIHQYSATISMTSVKVNRNCALLTENSISTVFEWYYQ